MPRYLARKGGERRHRIAAVCIVYVLILVINHKASRLTTLPMSYKRQDSTLVDLLHLAWVGNMRTYPNIDRYARACVHLEFKCCIMT